MNQTRYSRSTIKSKSIMCCRQHFLWSQQLHKLDHSADATSQPYSLGQAIIRRLHFTDEGKLTGATTETYKQAFLMHLATKPLRDTKRDQGQSQRGNGHNPPGRSHPTQCVNGGWPWAIIGTLQQAIDAPQQAIRPSKRMLAMTLLAKAMLRHDAHLHATEEQADGLWGRPMPTH